METVPYLDLRAQYRPLRSEVLSALEEICESTSFAQGPATSRFEAEFAAYCGVEHCVSLNSGTSALHLALRCLDVGPGDELTTAFYEEDEQVHRMALKVDRLPAPAQLVSRYIELELTKSKP